MCVDIKVGDQKVIASGTFVTDKDENTISLRYNNEELSFTSFEPEISALQCVR